MSVQHQFIVFALTAVMVAGGLAPPAHSADMAGPAISAAFGPDGRLWRAVPRKDWIEVDYSTDLGGSFSPPVRVNPKKMRLRVVPEDRPQIAVDSQGRVFVAWAADARQPWTRYMAYSGDGGRTFSAPAAVSDSADHVIQYQSVVQAPANGPVRIFWLEHHEAASMPAAGSLLLGTVSPGAWATPKKVLIHDAMCECCRIAVRGTADGGAVVLGRMVLGGRIRDLGMLTIRPDGSASPARRVTDDDWEINACPEHGPALGIGAGGRYHLAWFTMGKTRHGVFYAHSDDGGQTISTPLALGDRTKLPGHADVGAVGDTVALAWQQYDGKRTSIQVMLSSDNGHTWTPAREISGSSETADYPFVLSDGHALYVSWYATDSGYHLYPLTATQRS